MKTKEVMRLFGVKERTVRRWKAEGCPVTKNEDGTNNFDLEKLSDWKLNRKKKAMG